jgi:hypothetical protein
MLPAHKRQRRRLDSSRAGLFVHCEAALLSKSIRTWSFDRYRLGEVNPIRQVLFGPETGYITMPAKLYVGNLAFQATSQELKELFAQAGTVSVNVFQRRHEEHYGREANFQPRGSR